MIVDYIKFKNLSFTSENRLFMIHGNPRNLSNELEHDITSFYRKLDYKHISYVIDDDTQNSSIENSFYEQSLFDEKKIITLNIVSNSIPKNLKNFIESINNKLTDNKIIIKIDRQTSSFKNTKLYKLLSTNDCVIELYELKGKVLEQWVINKCKINKIAYDEDVINNLIKSNFNNSLAISQVIYQRSLLDESVAVKNFDHSKYTEYDLVDMLHKHDSVGFLKVSKYLENINTPLSYIIFLMNSELEKIYSVKQSVNNKPYIPQFLHSKYSSTCLNYEADTLLQGLKSIHILDLNSKYNARKSSPWVTFNDLFLNIINNT
jgi:DNA polymerase III delta subunit